MERRDGRDPLNAKTYSSPATIQSMIELRAFCAAFFDQLVRVRAPPINDHLLARFVTLITSKAALFARARAVIPELQLRLLNSEMAHLHPNVQRVLQATEDLRRSPDADGGVLIEGSVWSRLAQDGQERFGSEAEVVMRESKARPRKTSGANSPLGPGKSLVLSFKTQYERAHFTYTRLSNLNSNHGHQRFFEATGNSELSNSFE